MAESDNDRKVAALPENMALPGTSAPHGQRMALEQEYQRLRAERDLLRMLIDHVPAYVFAKVPFRDRQRLIHQASRDGLTQLLNRNTFFERLYHRADQAMYRAKALGGCHYRFHGTA